ncbi:SoxR reducing system RseC family protein [Endozoicomonas sp. Mp262]|uniref:SoxR reducing system RseC family protein n=1 Tax=Endozoicomonas sp. Mp262 TaxID=2919499 RepID=UPI0021D8A561
MIEEHAEVVAVNDQWAWLETARKSACDGCNAKSGCGKHLAEKFQRRSNKHYLRIDNDRTLSEGDRVIIGISEGALLEASVLVYFVPLLFLMAAIWLASFMGLSDSFTLLTGASGLFVGFVLVRLLSRRTSDLCHIKVLGIIPVNLDHSDTHVAKFS